MLTKEFYRTREDGVNLYKFESDKGFFILQEDTGRKYPHAIDVETSTHTYIETKEKIKKESEKHDETGERAESRVLREPEYLSANPYHGQLSDN